MSIILAHGIINVAPEPGRCEYPSFLFYLADGTLNTKFLRTRFPYINELQINLNLHDI